jgi:hypothetical protein
MFCSCERAPLNFVVLWVAGFRKLPENKPVVGTMVNLNPLGTQSDTLLAASSLTELLRTELRFPLPKVINRLQAALVTSNAGLPGSGATYLAPSSVTVFMLPAVKRFVPAWSAKNGLALLLSAPSFAHPMGTAPPANEQTGNEAATTAQPKATVIARKVMRLPRAVVVPQMMADRKAHQTGAEEAT